MACFAQMSGVRKVACVVFAAVLSLPSNLSAQTVPPAPTTSVLHADPSHPPETTGWVETRLYFGLGPAAVSKSGVSAREWQRFLDLEVTSRFPSGLSVSDLYGQWQGVGERQVSRLRSKVVILVYPATPENAQRIGAIRTAWKRYTGDQSVLKVTTAADVSF